MKHPDFDDVGDAIREDRPLRELPFIASASAWKA